MNIVSDFASRLKEALGDRPANTLAENIGLSKQAISMYTTGNRTPKRPTVEAIARELHVNPAWLMGYDVEKYLHSLSHSKSIYDIPNIMPMPEMREIPLLGTIACGTPILAVENIEERISIPAHIHADFALRCKGDSMINARIYDGDVVYVREQPEVENGQIAAVLIDDEATLKRVYFFPTYILLSPENTAYPPMVYTGDDMNNVRIIGRAVAFTSAL